MALNSSDFIGKEVVYSNKMQHITEIGTVEKLDVDNDKITVQIPSGKKLLGFSVSFKNGNIKFADEDLNALVEAHFATPKPAPAPVVTPKVSGASVNWLAFPGLIKFGSIKVKPYGCFSNFYPCKNGILYKGFRFKNSEAAWQSQKSTNPEDWPAFTSLSGTKAKEAGGKNGIIKLRPDWDMVKYDIMVEVLYAKFSQNPDIKEILLSTGNHALMEDTTGWHDNFWGNCLCPKCKSIPGENHLGLALMEVRDMLRKEAGTPTTAGADPASTDKQPTNPVKGSDSDLFMLGAIIGDIAGSRFEGGNRKNTRGHQNGEISDSVFREKRIKNQNPEFTFFTKSDKFTDDTVMTLAIAKALVECKGDYSNLSAVATKCMVEFGRRYPKAGFGHAFDSWIKDPKHTPYESFGNGSAMRVSPCGLVAGSIEEAVALSDAVTKVSHNHPEGMKGAEATAVAIYLAKSGKSKEEIREYINEHYYKMDFTLDDVKDNYIFHSDCMESVPQSLEAFFESNDFEDAVRKAVAMGGDSDTMGAIAGSVAQAYYGIQEHLKKLALEYLDDSLKAVLSDFAGIIK